MLIGDPFCDEIKLTSGVVLGVVYGDPHSIKLGKCMGTIGCQRGRSYKVWEFYGEWGT